LLPFLTGFIIFVFATVRASDFPAAPNWKPLTEIVYYNPDNLWEYIDGAAEQYIAYGFQNCSVGEFRSGDLSFTIDLYDMVEPINAFGIYATESRGIDKRRPIGSEAAFSPPSQCLMFKNKYYIKVFAFEGELTVEVAEKILTIIADKLAGNADMPAVLKRLPAGNRVSGSVGFRRLHYLGLSELKSCLYASYSDQTGEEYQIFIVVPAPGQTETQTFADLGEGWEVSQWNGLPLKLRKISSQGYVGVVLTKEGLTGVANLSDPEQIKDRLSALLQP
jgi:hypothetical protein